MIQPFNYHYYSFKIFLSFWLAKITHIIKKILIITSYCQPNLEEFCHIKPMRVKVQQSWIHDSSDGTQPHSIIVKYSDTNSPYWFPCFSLKNQLREFDKKSEHFLYVSHFLHFHHLFLDYAVLLERRKLISVTLVT